MFSSPEIFISNYLCWKGRINNNFWENEGISVFRPAKMWVWWVGCLISDKPSIVASAGVNLIIYSLHTTPLSRVKDKEIVFSLSQGSRSWSSLDYSDTFLPWLEYQDWLQTNTIGNSENCVRLNFRKLCYWSLLLCWSVLAATESLSKSCSFCQYLNVTFVIWGLSPYCLFLSVSLIECWKVHSWKKSALHTSSKEWCFVFSRFF